MYKQQLMFWLRLFEGWIMLSVRLICILVDDTVCFAITYLLVSDSSIE